MQCTAASMLVRYGAAFVAALCVAAAAGASSPPGIAWDRCRTFDPESGEAHIDAMCFFDLLVDRYRRLTRYEDVAHVLHVTEREGGGSDRFETMIGCAIADGKLHVETSGSRVRRWAGLEGALRATPAMEEAALRYQMWLAPHMALRFADEPKTTFRPGVKEGFTATEAETITVGDKPMVHLELRSGGGDGPRGDEECEATFDLYVNPDSFLIERIEGQERLPGGASCETTLDITPTFAEQDDEPETTTSAPPTPPAPGQTPPVPAAPPSAPAPAPAPSPAPTPTPPAAPAPPAAR